MQVISTVIDAITRPVQTAGSVASQALGIAMVGVRTSARVIGWVVNQGRSASGDAAVVSPSVTVVPNVTDEAIISPMPGSAVDEMPTNDTTQDVTASTKTAPAEEASADAGPAHKPLSETAAAKKATAKNAPSKAPTKKAPVKKAPVKKAPSASAATAAPAQAATGKIEGISSGTPPVPGVHRPGAGETKPSQPDTEPLLDPSTAKAIGSEAKVMQKASDRDKS